MNQPLPRSGLRGGDGCRATRVFQLRGDPSGGRVGAGGRPAERGRAEGGREGYLQREGGWVVQNVFSNLGFWGFFSRFCM